MTAQEIALRERIRVAVLEEDARDMRLLFHEVMHSTHAATLFRYWVDQAIGAAE